MIRTLIVDHHPALRAGVKVVLEAERDMVVVGDTGTLDELLPLLRRTRPDVVLLDCHPPMVADLRACRLVKCLLPAPRVLIYSAYADERLRVAARVAGADGLLDKNSSRARPGSGDPRRPQRPPPARTHRTRRRAGCDAVARPPGSADPRDAARRRTAVRDRRRAEHASRDRRATSERHPGPPVRGAALERGGRPMRSPCRVALRRDRPSPRSAQYARARCLPMPIASRAVAGDAGWRLSTKRRSPCQRH